MEIHSKQVYNTITRSNKTDHKASEESKTNTGLHIRVRQARLDNDPIPLATC